MPGHEARWDRHALTDPVGVEMKRVVVDHYGGPEVLKIVGEAGLAGRKIGT
jgi:hypothetical protein